MGFWNDLFGGSDQSYPTTPTGAIPPSCGDQPFTPLERDGFIDKLFAPKQLPYPLRVCSVPTGVTGVTTVSAMVSPSSTPVASVTASATPAATPGDPVSAASASTVGGPTPVVVTPIAPAAAPVSPVTVVISMPPSAPAPSVLPATAPVVPSAPAPIMPMVPPVAEPVLKPLQPTSIVLGAELINPRFRAHHPKAFDKAIEDMIEDYVSIKMITKQSAPVAFVVPDGCDSVQFSYGPIELNPGHGKPSDLDQIVTLGMPTVSGVEGSEDGTELRPLTPGSTLVVTIPWRVASFVEMPASRLKVTALARFFNSSLPAS